jgi:hypothetical protein
MELKPAPTLIVTVTKPAPTTITALPKLVIKLDNAVPVPPENVLLDTNAMLLPMDSVLAPRALNQTHAQMSKPALSMLKVTKVVQILIALRLQCALTRTIAQQPLAALIRSVLYAQLMTVPPGTLAMSTLLLQLLVNVNQLLDVMPMKTLVLLFKLALKWLM